MSDKIDWNKIDVSVPPAKKAVSIRLDEDVLAWFRAQGGQYLTHMNAVLRAYMEHGRKKRK